MEQPLQKLNLLFSPLDVVEITKSYEYFCTKDEDADLPKKFFDDAKMFLGTGEYSSRNPTCWHIFQGKEVDVDSKTWKKGVLNFFRLTSEPEISELDNERDHVLVEAKFEVLVVNAKDLPDNALKDVTCAIVKTSFGDFPLVDSRQEGDTD